MGWIVLMIVVVYAVIVFAAAWHKTKRR